MEESRASKQVSGVSLLGLGVWWCATSCVPPREVIDGVRLGHLNDRQRGSGRPPSHRGFVVGYAGSSDRKGLEKFSIGCLELTASIGRRWLVCRGDVIPDMIPAHSCHVIAAVDGSRDIGSRPSFSRGVTQAQSPGCLRVAIACAEGRQDRRMRVVSKGKVDVRRPNDVMLE